MTLYSRIKDCLKKRRWMVKITRPWMGEKGLGKPMPKDKKVTREEIWEDFLGKRGDKDV